MPLNTRTALQYRVPRALEHIPLLVKVTRLGTSFLRVRVCWSGVRGLQTTNLQYTLQALHCHLPRAVVVAAVARRVLVAEECDLVRTNRIVRPYTSLEGGDHHQLLHSFRCLVYLHCDAVRRQPCKRRGVSLGIRGRFLSYG